MLCLFVAKGWHAEPTIGAVLFPVAEGARSPAVTGAGLHPGRVSRSAAGESATVGPCRVSARSTGS
jgi:hypothetical protein